MEEERIEEKDQKFFDACNSILEMFDWLINRESEDKDDRISSFIDDYFPIESEGENEKENFDRWHGLIAISFGLGFAIGQKVEVPSHLEGELKTIDETLKEEKILPYFPRERKAA
jgi:hypothetical protein